jgi:hypothetical protein
MMNWIYNWYDPAGKLSVNELVENVTRLFLTGFVGDVSFSPMSLGTAFQDEQLSVWRSNS